MISCVVSQATQIPLFPLILTTALPSEEDSLYAFPLLDEKGNHLHHERSAQDSIRGDSKTGIWVVLPLGPSSCDCPSESLPILSPPSWAGSSAFRGHSTPPALLSPLPPWQLHARGTAQSRWLTGEMVRPVLNFRLSCSLFGGLKVNFCTREVKKINSSDLANCSPRHTLFPERQSIRQVIFPFGVGAQLGLTSSTSRKT